MERRTALDLYLKALLADTQLRGGRGCVWGVRVLKQGAGRVAQHREGRGDLDRPALPYMKLRVLQGFSIACWPHSAFLITYTPQGLMSPVGSVDFKCNPSIKSHACPHPACPAGCSDVWEFLRAGSELYEEVADPASLGPGGLLRSAARGLGTIRSAAAAGVSDTLASAGQLAQRGASLRRRRSNSVPHALEGLGARGPRLQQQEEPGKDGGTGDAAVVAPLSPGEEERDSPATSPSGWQEWQGAPAASRSSPRPASAAPAAPQGRAGEAPLQVAQLQQQQQLLKRPLGLAGRTASAAAGLMGRAAGLSTRKVTGPGSGGGGEGGTSSGGGSIQGSPQQQQQQQGGQDGAYSLGDAAPLGASPSKQRFLGSFRKPKVAGTSPPKQPRGAAASPLNKRGAARRAQSGHASDGGGVNGGDRRGASPRHLLQLGSPSAMEIAGWQALAGSSSQDEEEEEEEDGWRLEGPPSGPWPSQRRPGPAPATAAAAAAGGRAAPAAHPLVPSLDPEDAAGISAPLYDIVDCLFMLQTRGFFRRQVGGCGRWAEWVAVCCG